MSNIDKFNEALLSRQSHLEDLINKLHFEASLMPWPSTADKMRAAARSIEWQLRYTRKVRTQRG